MSEEDLKHIEKTLGQGISFRARCIRKLIAEINRLKAMQQKRPEKRKETLLFSNGLKGAA